MAIEYIEAFRSLSDEMRLRILEMLAAKPRTLEELNRDLPRAETTLAYHLTRMRRAGLVEPRRCDGRYEYALAPGLLHELQAFFAGLCERADACRTM